jgi:hypothetical protein
MRINNLLLLMIVLSISGCYIGSKSYDIFSELNNSIIQNKTSFNSYLGGYVKENYSDELYIYIRNNNKRNIPEECIYGFITKKDDPKQIAIDWIILSGKEFCNNQQQWVFSF